MSGSLRPILLLITSVFVLGLVAGTVGYVTKADAEPQNRLFVAAESTTGTRGVLQFVDANTITILTASGSQSFSLDPETIVEKLSTTDQSRISVGDWLNAGAVPHAQTTFTIIGLTVIPSSLLRE